MGRRLRYGLLCVLYAISAGLTVVAFTGDGGQPVVPGLLLAALATALTLSGIRWTERRRERHRLRQAHGLSAYDTASTNPEPNGRIRLQRPWTWRNCLSEYIVEIDGRKMGKLRSRASAEYPVAPGPHDVRVRLDTTGYPEKGYLGSPTFDAQLADGERLELDVVALPASYSSFGVQQSTDDPEGWLLLAPSDPDRSPALSRLARIRKNWLRYTLGLVSSVALLCTWFVFPKGSAAWWNSEAVVLLGAGTLIYLRFGRSWT